MIKMVTMPCYYFDEDENVNDHDHDNSDDLMIMMKAINNDIDDNDN